MVKRFGQWMIQYGKMKAALTVEASIWIPFAFFMILGGINIGYDLFQQAGINAEIHEELIRLDPVKIVRKQTVMEQFKNEWKGEAGSDKN